MIKNSIILLSFSILLQAQAMQDTSCFLAYMPPDVQNYILCFLTGDDETEEEFIARTKNTEIPSDKYDEFFITETNVFPKLHKPLPTSIGTLRMFSPDETKVITLRLSSDSSFHSILTIIDLKKTEIMHIDEKFKKGNYKHVALSSSFHNMIATVEDAPETDQCSTFKFNQCCKKSLLIRDYARKEIRKIETPHIRVASIGFNKQGTHIIVHQVQQHYLKDYPNPVIYPLNIDGCTIEMFKKRDEVKILILQDCLRDRMICKSIEGSK